MWQRHPEQVHEKPHHKVVRRGRDDADHPEAKQAPGNLHLLLKK
jgi:hypothetical protein